MQKKKDTNISVFAFHLPGVGKQIAKHLARLDIYSVQDLLFHLPLRYQNRTRVQAIRQVRVGEEAVIEGIIDDVLAPGRGRTKLLCELNDGHGTLHLRFFHAMSYLTDALKPGTRVRCYGEIKWGVKGLEMVHPEFKVLLPNKSQPIEQSLTPVYPATEGLSQYTLRKLTSNALSILDDKHFSEFLPETLLQQWSLPTFKDALRFVHRPPSNVLIQDLLENKTHAQKRLIFEELLVHRISLLHLKQGFQNQTGIALTNDKQLINQFQAALPFQLTAAQRRVSEEIEQDLWRAAPMLRLVQGDVGSGKTVVAAIAMLQAVACGYQAALMAPTELLAEQHHRVFTRWLASLGVKVVFLSGNVKASARKAALTALADGSAQIILGTHALFQEDVAFAKLALVIVDEQHRFGVHQRALLRDKGSQNAFYPHQLIMTATPIPRTLAMSFYADLDCSTIDELPPGRTPIVTSVMMDNRRVDVITRIQEACHQGRQVYWVCPLIEESEALGCQAATKTAEELQAALPDLQIGLVHGRLSATEKEAAMQAFQQGGTHLLVATTVIEVGVDVPNASVMVIENAERLGLSQLHQLRGRVGRGAAASHCILLYRQPLSPTAKERLQVMRETTDGFKIAQRDLELRGPGEVLGTKQTGDLSFRVADLLRDSHLLPQVQQAADVMLRDHQDKIALLVKRWIGDERIEYGKI